MKNNEREEIPFLPISELSKQLDLPAHTLRYWEKEFPKKIVPVTGAGGRRYYRPETVENIHAIKNYLYKQGYTIEGVKKLIKEDTFDAAMRLQTAMENRAAELASRTIEDIGMAINLLESAMLDLKPTK